MATNLQLRLITAAIAIPSVISSILLWNGAVFGVFLIIMALQGMREYQIIVRSCLGSKPPFCSKLMEPASYILAALIMIAAQFQDEYRLMEAALGASWVIHTTIFVVSEVYAAEEQSVHVLNTLAAHILGLVYVSWSLAHGMCLRRLEHGGGLVASMLLVSWAADACAYLFGAIIGGRKLAPRVSPAKTVAGLFAAIVAGTAAMTAFGLLREYLPWMDLPEASLGHYAVLGFLNGTIGAAGDMLASCMKRAGQMKDSGTLFRGHGGVLDRFDTFYLVTPIWYAYARWLL
eukprot:TRINITY_DN9982_c0_g1_i1.p1 TRINITY_DN9982_c0_g1~~TRINITY_DN9982_c0_g1_i1.p1  ORF type:complete len:289 (+),score=39.24 TRINITY_DN9982_c0_g1_i1:132-998(+)